jgi:hypothetical protein
MMIMRLRLSGSRADGYQIGICTVIGPEQDAVLLADNDSLLVADYGPSVQAA